ncbi:hypothetical protein HMPREF9005_0428 [Actinomyces sp. oral taxon 178 str. F0338]|nr:hypothetical protein HMPREF9005_0428 [Actinomyces sp. oral taxon 178 str. F0338]
MRCQIHRASTTSSSVTSSLSTLPVWGRPRHPVSGFELVA